MTESPNPASSVGSFPPTPDVVPRLPVLGWRSFEGRGARDDTLLAAPHLVFTTSGCAAIWLALKELGVGAGDRVLVPTYHCPTMIAPTIHAGAEPIFYPVTVDGVDTSFLAKLDSRRVKALLVAHFFGRPVAMSQLRAFCDSRGIALIEDCAHALFGMTEGRPVGAWGDFAVGSLTKFLPVPEGGCLVSWRRPMKRKLDRQTVRAELKCVVDILEVGARYQRLPGLNTVLSTLFKLKNAIRRPKRPEPASDPVPDSVDATAEFDTSYASSAPTHTTRLVVSALGWRRIRDRRRSNYMALARALGELADLRILYPELPDRAAPYVLPVWVKDPEPRYRALRSAGCPVFRWEWPWPGTPLLPGDEGLGWSRHVFQLPCHQDLTEQDLAWLAAAVRQVMARPSVDRVSVSPAPAQQNGAKLETARETSPADVSRRL